jgi:hypothetical protein
VFENSVLRIFGPKSDELTGKWRKLRKEFCNLYYSPSNRTIMSRRVRWAGHIAGMGKKKMNVYRLFVGNQRDREH